MVLLLSFIVIVLLPFAYWIAFYVLATSIHQEAGTMISQSTRSHGIREANRELAGQVASLVLLNTTITPATIPSPFALLRERIETYSWDLIDRLE
jgi:hypothetical protein